VISRIPVVGVAGDSGRLYPFSTIGGEGYESLISCCRFNLDGGFVLDVSAKRGQQVMAGRLYSIPDRNARFWRPIFVGPCEQGRGYSYYRITSKGWI